MSGTTTIDNSGVLTPVAVGGRFVIQQDAGTTLAPVSVTLSGGAADAFAFSTVTARNGGTVVVSSDVNIGVDDHFIIGGGGEFELATGGSVSVVDDLSFNTGTAGGTLVLDPGYDVSSLGNISGFTALDTIDFSGIGSPFSGTSYTDSFAGGETSFTLALAGGGSEVFALAGNLTADSFSLTSTPGNGLAFTDTACFAAGTKILTDAGEIPVQDLIAGDIAILADGTARPIIFIGHRLFDLARHPRPQAVRPVRIAAGALADGVPCRELVVSPDHALLLDGVLVQAKDLVDGAVITQDFAIPTIRYYHVELVTHGILLAEGAAVESYLDTGHRGMFDNSDEPLILHPDLMQIRREAESVAPLCGNGEILGAIRAVLHARKRALGFTLRQRPEIRLRAGGRLLAPDDFQDGIVSFTLPAGVRVATLVSPVFVPAEIDPGTNDRRRLGLALSAIFIDDQRKVLDAIVTGGLHARGAGDTHVWTDGAARLALPAGASRLSLCIAGAPQHWQRAA